MTFIAPGRIITNARSPAAAEVAARHEMIQQQQIASPAKPKASPFHVYLAKWPFCFCWWLVLAFHVITGSLAASFAALNQYLVEDRVNSFFWAIPYKMKVLSSRSFAVVAVGHTFAISRMVWNSVRARCLTFHSMPAPKAAQLTSSKSSDLLHQAKQPYGVVRSTWQKYFSINGYFGLNGEYFEIAFTIRETIEIALQTYQAYNLSLSVPILWINQLAVGAIVLNCVSSPLIHVVFHQNVGVRRLINVVQDSILDFTCSVVIPVAVALPYVLLFDTTTFSFPFDLVMDDVWYISASTTSKQVLVTSVPDFISTVMPQLSILGCLMTIKNVLRRQCTRVEHGDNEPPHLNADVNSADSTTTDSDRSNSFIGLSERPHSRPDVVHVIQTTASGRIQFAPHNRHVLPRRSPRRWRWVAVHALFITWGIVVLGLHLQATHKTASGSKSCKLVVGAWYTTGLACAVLNLNCHVQQIQGSTNEVATILDELDRTTLQILVYSHCTALHIPQVATEFSRVTIMELFNSTLVDWPENAALSDHTQPAVKYLGIILTNWTESFPVGILHDHLPKKLGQLIVVGNNMTALPATIGDLWSGRNWRVLSMDLAPSLREIPPSYCKITAQWISFASTGIKQLPDNCFNETMGLTISGSPITSLSATVASSLMYLEAEHTIFTALPAAFSDWIFSQPAEESFALLHGSVLCNSTDLLNSSEYWDAYCGFDASTTRGSYNWDRMLPQRQYEPNHAHNY